MVGELLRSGRVGPFGPADAGAVGTAVVRSGLVRFYRPDQAVRLVRGISRHGFGPAAGPLVGRVMCAGKLALVDDDGSLTFAELDRACDAAGDQLSAVAGARVGLLTRNSRGLYAAMVGAARAGIDVVYLNTGSSAEQVARTCRAEGITALVHDAEFAGRRPAGLPAFDVADLLTASGPIASGLSARGPIAGRTPPGRPGPAPRTDDPTPTAADGGRRSRHIILTSGTTGRPRGVARSAIGVGAAVTLLGGLPYRARQRHLIAAPGFHAWGWLNLLLTMLLSSTVVLTRRFDPERILALIERERCEVLVAVPAMLQRLIGLDPSVQGRYDTSSLRVVSVSGSPLPHRLAAGFMDVYGEVLFNLYGSTEAAFATVAGPADLRAAPDTAGRPLPGVRVRVTDEAGRDLPPGQVGAVVVGSGSTFAGYTSGEDRPRTATGVEVGDLGRFDAAGRLFLVGRADDLVVTGGENVYPGTVEAALERHPAVVEAAVFGVPDLEFGQVLIAHAQIAPVRPAAEPAIPDEDELRNWARGLLAPFEVPRRVVLHDQPLPRNDTGKLLKNELRDQS